MVDRPIEKDASLKLNQIAASWVAQFGIPLTGLDSVRFWNLREQVEHVGYGDGAIDAGIHESG